VGDDVAVQHLRRAVYQLLLIIQSADIMEYNFEI